MDPTPKPVDKKFNIWLVISIILMIALISVLATNVFKNKQTKLITIPPDQAASKLVDFINKIYGPQVGIATLKSVSEENGLYKVEVKVINNNESIDQTIFITYDGKLFIPQTIDIEDVLAQYEAFQKQQQNIQPQTNPPAPTE